MPCQQSDCAFSNNLTSLLTIAMLDDAYYYANYTSVMKNIYKWNKNLLMVVAKLASLTNKCDFTL